MSLRAFAEIDQVWVLIALLAVLELIADAFVLENIAVANDQLAFAEIEAQRQGYTKFSSIQIR